MKIFTRPILITLLLTFFFSSYSFAQLTAWEYQKPYTAHENAGMTLIDYQLRLQVNTQALIGASQMNSNGDDIRFADACGTMVYPHWVEKDLNTDSTIIWVMVDSIGALDSMTVYMFYGNPAASNNSSFSATFPNGIITAGDITLSGAQNLGYLKVNAGDTLFLGTNTVLDITARYVEVNGVIWGKGKGYVSPGGSQAGSGPGGGGTSTNSGSGGGSYGGIGGLGGYDSGDTPGNGGPVYGTSNQISDIDKGSSGGSSSVSLGGSGGGGISVNAEWVILTGTVNMDGDGGQLPGGGQCGGGGAGGGIRVIADHMTVSGVVSAKGGVGSPGTSTANDSGGGGAGGRVKAFHGTSFNVTTVPDVSGGLGGPYGTAAAGAPGGTGSLFDTTYAFNPVTITTQAAMGFGYSISGAPVGSICEGTPVTLTVNSLVGDYSFYVDGNLSQTGSTASFTTTLTDGSHLIVVEIGNACNSSDSVSVAVNPSPTTTIDRTLIDPCEGETYQLFTMNNGYSVMWSTGETTDTIYVTTSGTYTLTLTDSLGCSGMDSTPVNFIPLPQPVITISGDTLFCNPGYVAYQWNLNGNPISGATGTFYVPLTSGTYSVTVDSFFCSNTSDTTFVLVGMQTQALAGIQIAPNPTQNWVKVMLDNGIQGEGQLRLMDLTGRVLLQENWSANGQSSAKSLDLTAYPAGSYLLMVEFRQGRFTQLVVKQ